MMEIIWLHIKACRRDIKAYRIGDLTISNRRAAGQIVVCNERREWRLK